MSLASAINLAQQYGQRGLDLEPMPTQPFQMSVPQMPWDTGPSTAQRAVGLGSTLLKSYQQRKATPGPGAGSQPSHGPVMLPSQMGLGGPSEFSSLPHRAGGGRVVPGQPYEMGEFGPEELIDQQGNQQMVGQSGPEVVTPQEPAVVIPNSRTPVEIRQRMVGPRTDQAMAEDGHLPADNPSAGYFPGNTESRARIADPGEFMREKVSDELMGHYGMGEKAPSRKKAVLIGAGLAAQRALQAGAGWQGALAAAATGAAIGGVKPELIQRAQSEQKGMEDQQVLDQLQKNQLGSLSEGMKRAQIASQYGNIGIKQGQLGVAQQRANTGDRSLTVRQGVEDAKLKYGYDRLTYQGKKDLADRISREFNATPDFDPDDPDNAKMVAAMEAANIPVFKKTASNQVQLVQDKDTGAWTAVAVNKRTGQGTASAVDDGKGGQFKTTAPHLLTMQEIDRRAENAAKGKKGDDAKKAGDLARAASFEEAAASYDKLAQEGFGVEARSSRAKAIQARQKAKEFRGKWGQ